MIEKEKAKELILKYYNYVGGWTSTNKPNEVPTAQYEGESMKIGRAKQCALIAVDEVYNNIVKSSPLGKYWQDVKKEIEKL